MRQVFVKFLEATTITGLEYEDSRQNYKGRSGLLRIQDGPNGKVACDFFTLDSKGHVSRIAPSSGQFVENDVEITIRTNHSIYKFSKSYNLTNEEEESLLQEVELR